MAREKFMKAIPDDDATYLVWRLRADGGAAFGGREKIMASYFYSICKAALNFCRYYLSS